MMADAGIKVLLTQEHWRSRFLIMNYKLFWWTETVRRLRAAVKLTRSLMCGVKTLPM